ncbi:hypothetical protein BK133_01695 [Paenibacillus sp. FSL H8-0548]|uniref:hypothetical protein n=1 Tax=Paenibacillus sp. FSL H8-0548 TaxID=1920422 RepID=UPI00096EF412|nr:hypothetical protein [Paenibacillus sp. FSL H8-0548]OMF38265.1 hypothetical protein BK133_01695 [Paenibacillus sp. FSL H8-0548]
MSRSWERKVRKNMNVVNKNRKKQGSGQIVLNAEKSDKITGRNFIAPIMLIIFIGMYVFLMSGSSEFKMDTMFWVTVGCYILLAALFFFRKPYITIGKDFVQSRRLTGDKRIQASGIKGIIVQKGYVIIQQHKGGNWMFSKMTNRFPTEEIGEKLKAFAQANGIPFEEK